MADIFYGVDREGVVEPRVTISASTTSEAIELRVAQAVNITKKDILRALTRIMAAVRTDDSRSDL